MRDAPGISIRLVLGDDGACAVLVSGTRRAGDAAPHIAALASALSAHGLRLAGVSFARSPRDGASPVAASETIADAVRRLLPRAAAVGART